MDLKQVLQGTSKPPITAPSQNLINPAKLSPRAAPPGFYKAIVLDGLSTGSALLFGYRYFAYLAWDASPWYVLAALLAFAALSVLQAFLQRSMLRRTLVVAAEALGLMVFFVAYDDWRVVLIAGLAAFVFLLWGYAAARSYLGNSIEIPFFGTSHAALGKLTTAALLVMILVYAPQVSTRGILISEASFKTFFDWASGFLDNFFPGVPFNDSFRNFSQGLAKMELENNPTFRTMSRESQNAAIAQASTQIGRNFARSIGVAPEPNAHVSDVIYAYIVTTLASWQARYQGEFIVGWTIVLFLVLRTIGTVFVWAAQIFALIVYEILLSSGFMHVSAVSQSKEIVEY